MSDAWGPPTQGRPPRRQGPNPRTVAWVIAGIAVAAVLVRTHRITTAEVLILCAVVPSVILHEVSHGAVALAFGDDTARRAGRLTLNPLRHIDPFGTIILPALMVLSGHGAIAYAKPVPVNVSRLRRPRNQNVVVALVGPAVNVVLAVGCGLAYRTLVPQSTRLLALGSEPRWIQFVFYAGFVNVILAVFNLIPLPPLDGSAVLERLLPRRALPTYYRIRPFTIVVPLVIVAFFPGVLNGIFLPALREWGRLVGGGGASF